MGNTPMERDKMKNILIPTDFSENAWNATVYAMHFLAKQRCTIYFLHTYTPAFYRLDYALGGTSQSALPDPGADSAQAKLEATLAKVKALFPNAPHQLETLSAFNTLTDEIGEMVRKKNIDLIVMGTQGATGAKRVFLGSNTVFVLRKATVPVLAVPNDHVFVTPKNILFPSDFQEHHSPEEVGIVQDTAQMFGAAITLLHIWEVVALNSEQKRNKEHLLGLLKNTAFEQWKVQGKKFPEAVLEYVETNQVDLLVMMNRNHSFFERVLLRQSIDQIGFQVQVPFLVVPGPKNP
ncbi:universal stress protein [Maribacter sp. 2307ULW6-5]|uniref:universal stress protein n=1 Tax=Maribacter sp. 2307ULW6-5 TaxID=3386275 RepID=UPI0039BD4D9A